MIYSKKNALKSTLLLFICFYTYPTNIKNKSNSGIITPNNLFSTIKTCSQQIKKSVINKCLKYYNTWFNPNIELSTDDKMIRLLDTLTSDEMSKLIAYTQCPNLTVAEEAFCIVKKYWPWHREYTFLIPNLDNNTEEADFIEQLGIDIMKITERDLITRQDYITKHTDPQSFKIILKYSKDCIELQKNGDLDGLLNETNRLRNRVIKNGKKTILADNICLAIVEKIYLAPVTKLIHTIKYAPTLEEAEKAFQTLEKMYQK